LSEFFGGILNMNPWGLSFREAVFLFFFFSFSGWLGETIMESLVRRRFVSKGVFWGPYVPVHGVGAFAVCLFCGPLKSWPLLVFLTGAVLCTVVEYLAALFLERVFHTQGWDYETYPFTRHCHYKRRIALSTSLFFGFAAFAVIYFYWDLGRALARLISFQILNTLDLIFALFFLVDAFFTGLRCVRNKRAGIPNKIPGLE
jgi:uncharacterized membrane protein